MSPNLSQQRTWVGKDRDECEGAEAARSDGPGQPKRDWITRRGSADGGELPAGEADLETLSAGGGGGGGASEGGAALQPEQGKRGKGGRGGGGSGDGKGGGGEAVWGGP